MFKIYCRALYRSLYDPAQYREAIVEWKGFGGMYLVLLSVVISAFVVGFLAYNTYVFQTQEMPYMLEQMPVITIKQGVVSIDKPSPVTIKGKDTGFTMIIDTKLPPNELENKQATFALGKTFAILKSGEDFKYVAIDHDQNIVITKERISTFVKYVLHIMPLVIYPLAVMTQSINYLFQAFLIAVGSFVLTAIIRRSYDFEARMRLSALALTPAIVVNTVSLIVFQHPVLIWFNFLLGLLFIYTMILLLPRDPVIPADKKSE